MASLLAVSAPATRARCRPPPPLRLGGSRPRLQQQRTSGVVCYLASSGNGGSGSSGGSSSSGRQEPQLHDPARIGSTTHSSVPVKNHPPRLDIDTYMRLPVSQYSELDPQLIQPLEAGGGRFRLHVPRISLFGVWLEPVVDVAVRQAADPPRVVLESVGCRLRGSDLVQKLRLDERFALRFATDMTWSPCSSSSGGGGSGAAGAGLAGGPAAPAPPSSSSSSSSMQQGEQQQGRIEAAATVEVQCEVLPPFSLLPRAVLESTGSAVVAALCRSLLPVFLRKLADDYERWANDEGYRAARAQRAAAAAALSFQPPAASGRR